MDYKDLDKEKINEIIKLYSENHSISKISKTLHIDKKNIKKVLLENNIKIKPIGFYTKGKPSKKRFDMPEQEIIKQYLSGKTIKEIAEEYKCSSNLIWDRLKINNVKIRIGKENKKLIERMTNNNPMKNKIPKSKRTDIRKKINEIMEMYNKIGAVETAKEFNCSPNLINIILKENNISIKPKGYFCKNKAPWNKGLTKENTAYLKRISEDMKINNPMKNPKSVKKVSESIKKLYDDGLIHKNKGKTYEEIYGKERAKEIKEKRQKTNLKIGISEKYSERMKSNNPMKIPEIAKKVTETKRERGWFKKEKNPFYGKEHTFETRKKVSATKQEISLEQWKDFIGFEPYTSDFNKQFKLAIKQRDGFLCLKCGMREEDSKILFKKTLHIHHINYDKKLTIQENCCSLCLRCNAEVNSNRKSWTKFFQSLLSERYGYQYAETGEIVLNLIKN